MIVFVFPWVIDMVFPLWDPRRQTLHDKVTRTVVIKSLSGGRLTRVTIRLRRRRTASESELSDRLALSPSRDGRSLCTESTQRVDRPGRSVRSAAAGAIVDCLPTSPIPPGSFAAHASRP